jgi:hypothetical protein
MFAWDAVLQWMLCTGVAKYSGLYMRVEVSLGQGVHGLFIIVPIIFSIAFHDTPTSTAHRPGWGSIALTDNSNVIYIFAVHAMIVRHW